MFSTELRNRIGHLNPWLLNPADADKTISRFFPPDYVNRTLESVTTFTNRAFMIVGPRQAGKSTLIWHQLKKYLPDILFLNMEDPLLRSTDFNVAEFVSNFQEEFSFIKAIFIDEVQHMEEAGLFIKGLVDSKLNIPIWVSGSSSFDLRSKTRESLAGRAIRSRLLPFSLVELLKHHKPANSFQKAQFCNIAILHQLLFGSYPAVYMTPTAEHKKLFLSDLVDALILRDASDLFKIKRIDAFRKLLVLLAKQVGDVVNISEIASLCGIDSGTVNSYIEILDESHIVKKVRPFAHGKRREIIGASKVFFIDNGIRNQLLNAFSADMELRTDKGKLWENWVFSEMYKMLPFQSEVKFWRSKSKAEVDFVIEYAGKIYALEVKSTELKKPIIGKSIHSFLSAYPVERLAILNMSLDLSMDLYQTQIDFLTPLNLVDWLMEIIS